MSIRINTSAGEKWAEQFAIYTQDDIYIPRIYVNDKLSYSCGLTFSEYMSGYTAAPAARNIQGTVTIPSHLSPDEVIIGVDGFSGTAVREVKILGRMEIIASAFAGCTELTSVVAKPSSSYEFGLASIQSKAFMGCTQLKTADFSQYSTLTTIGDEAFKDCTNLTSILLPEGLTTIGAGAFMNCTSLRHISLPSTVESINADAFNGCALQSIHLTGVKIVGERAFKGCKNLSSVTGCSHLKNIKLKAFEECPHLTTFAFKPALTNIGGYAFSDCPNLNIRAGLYHTSLRGIGVQAFNGNTCTVAAFPESLRYTASGVLYNTSVTAATLPYGHWSGRDSSGNQADSIDVTSTTSSSLIAACLRQKYLSWEYLSAWTLKPIICISSTSASLEVGVYRETYASALLTPAYIRVYLQAGPSETPVLYFTDEYAHEAEQNEVFILNPVTAYLIKVEVGFEDGNIKNTVTTVNSNYDESTTALIDEQTE